MRQVTGTMLTTHIDLQGDRIEPSGLSDMVADLNGDYLPTWVQHDPRIPPVGRLEHAELQVLPDGEMAVVATSTLFEPTDAPPYKPSNRLMRIRSLDDPDRLSVCVDRSYFNDPDQSELRAIATALAADIKTEFKKGLGVPTTIVLVVGGFAITQLAVGFLTKAGSDAWDAAKSGLKRIFARRRASGEGPDHLLVLQWLTTRSQMSISVELIMINPTDVELDALNAKTLLVIDEKLSHASLVDRSLRRIVFEYRDGRVELKYVVRADCFPLRLINDELEPLDD
jgi:hypothetical protein